VGGEIVRNPDRDDAGPLGGFIAVLLALILLMLV
jgi:hypothetical protein